jgi:hypothetical protein
MQQTYKFSRGVEGGRNRSKRAAAKPLYVEHF